MNSMNMDYVCVCVHQNAFQVIGAKLNKLKNEYKSQRQHNSWLGKRMRFGLFKHTHARTFTLE